ncbi:MAG TPA: serine/threonine-protein kinase [Casimicrobiaceae bacterium]|jgi:serine/threonine-protein kinase
MAEPLTLGKYEIQSVLGKGAMGVVYKAFDPHIERTVAIKTVRKDLVDPDLAAQFMGRFKNEARAAGRLHHPNIVGVYEYGEDEKVAFIAMEYVDGTGLREYFNRKARFEFGQLIAITSQLLQALEFAHVRGVVHRDIKPANLMLTSGGALKVADFGIARIDTTTLTMTGMVMGTPSYMSPEQCQGKDSDHRSDLFSAGVVLYELLTGERPFRGSPEMIAYNICNETPRPPSQVSPLKLPPAIDDIISTALAKSPDARFQNAHAFNHALQLAAGGTVGAALEATVVNLAHVELGPAPTTQWDDATLATVERNFAHYVGPMARLIVRRAATQTHDVSELYSLLAANITDREERDRFVATMPGASTGAAIRTLHTGERLIGSHGLAATGSRGTAPVSERSGSVGSRGMAPIPLEAQFVQETTQRLLVYLGPIGRVVAKRAAAQAKSQQEFVQLVADHIGTQDRGTFLREVGFDG